MRVTPLLPLLVSLLAGCGGASGQGPLELSWAFVDGRDCPASGASAIAVKVGSNMPVNFPCRDGHAPQALLLEMVPRGGSLELTALSPQSTELYRGDTRLDPTLSPVTVTLYATFGR